VQIGEEWDKVIERQRPQLVKGGGNFGKIAALSKAGKQIPAIRLQVYRQGCARETTLMVPARRL
jgi:hypothetical protein